MSEAKRGFRPGSPAGVGKTGLLTYANCGPDSLHGVDQNSRTFFRNGWRFLLTQIESRGRCSQKVERHVMPDLIRHPVASHFFALRGDKSLFRATRVILPLSFLRKQKSRLACIDWILAFASMTQKGELEVVSKAAPQCSTLCAVDVLVYRVHLEKLSAHGDVRRPQYRISLFNPRSFWGKSNENRA